MHHSSELLRRFHTKTHQIRSVLLVFTKRHSASSRSDQRNHDRCKHVGHIPRLHLRLLRREKARYCHVQSENSQVRTNDPIDDQQLSNTKKNNSRDYLLTFFIPDFVSDIPFDFVFSVLFVDLSSRSRLFQILMLTKYLTFFRFPRMLQFGTRMIRVT